MKPNMGILDRGIRVGIALFIALLYFGGFISGTAALVLGVLAVVFVLTSAVGTCPLYLPFGFDTRLQGNRGGSGTGARGKGRKR